MRCARRLLLRPGASDHFTRWSSGSPHPSGGTCTMDYCTTCAMMVARAWTSAQSASSRASSPRFARRQPPPCRVQCNRGVGGSTPSRTITQRQAHVSRVINGAADHLAQTLKRGRVTGEWLGSVEAGRHGRAGGGQGALPAASTLGAGRQGCVLSGGAVSSLTGLTCLRLSS
jgi:hypothetical protein